MKLNELLGKEEDNFYLGLVDREAAIKSSEGIEEKLKEMYELSQKKDGQQANDKEGAKFFAKTVNYVVAQGAIETIAEKEPSYHERIVEEIRSKKGEADIDFEYLEQKMPLLGAVNATFGVYSTKAKFPDLESYMASKFDPVKAASGLGSILAKADGKKYQLNKKEAETVIPYFLAQTVLPSLLPELKQAYDIGKKELIS